MCRTSPGRTFHYDRSGVTLCLEQDAKTTRKTRSSATADAGDAIRVLFLEPPFYVATIRIWREGLGSD